MTTDAGTAEIAAVLRRAVRGAVADDPRRRAEYSTDASNYRVPPLVVVEPLDVDDVLAVLDVAAGAGVPVTSRGAGTSIAGNAIGPGVVIDFSRHLRRIVELDPQARTARVEPGVVLADLQRAAAPFGLRFGPDPSTHARATLGGMLGNNACGPHAVAYGRTADNVVALDVVDGNGRQFTATRGSGTEHVTGLDALVDANLDIIRTELGRFSRQVSGYSLEHLLPEHGRDLAKALVGSEGTLTTTLHATLRLVPVSPVRLLVVLGYPDMASAADAVPALLAHRPLAIEGLDARLVDAVRGHRGDRAVPDLPRGAGWLMVEVARPDEAATSLAAAAIVSSGGALDAAVLPPGPAATAMWRIREDGAGLAGRTPAGAQAWPGWEDAAVPPERLGDYVRAFEALMTSYRVVGVPYGHFGDGCLHVRLDIPLEQDGRLLREFVTQAARLVVEYGGSCSGEHGDGRARSELLPLMYSERMLEVFAGVKALFDPVNRLNPGVLVRPEPLDADLRRPRAHPVLARGGFAFTEDGGDLTRALHRCVGVGKCRADNSASGGFMCPSYLATRDEKDSTRGRARVLQEVTTGAMISSWSAQEVRESLDLCLSCKACASDCPAGVDMATYKSEVLHRTYRRRRRPVSHYSLGWLPRWLRVVSAVPGLPSMANAVLDVGWARRTALRVAGVDPRRSAPPLARTSFHRLWRQTRAGLLPDTRTASRGPLVLWVDSFTAALSPAVAMAAARVLTSAGFDVLVPERRSCCGLTWITTGQLDAARSRLRTVLEALTPYAERAVPVVGLEPSCVAVLRSDLAALLPEDPRTPAVSETVRTLGELLTSLGDSWEPPSLEGRSLVVQPHCHHHAIMGFGTDLELLGRSGASVDVLAGCCGLAGNFGMERGHYEASVAVAGHALLPALRSAEPGAVLLADGFSCRTQIADLTGLPALHLAELLDTHPQPPGQ